MKRVSWTMGLIISLTIAFVAGWSGAGEALVSNFAFSYDTIAAKPWTVFTYPWASPGIGNALFFFLLAMLWLWWTGKSVEEENSGPIMLGIYLIFAAISAVTLALFAATLKGEVMLYGSWMPTSAITMIWAARRPTQEIRLYGIIPLQARWIAVLTAAIAVFSIGSGQPLVGLSALIPLGLAWLWGSGKLPVRYPVRASAVSRVDRKAAKRRQEEFDQFIDGVRSREQEREERERLRKLFESSLSEGQNKGDER